MAAGIERQPGALEPASAGGRPALAGTAACGGEAATLPTAAPHPATHRRRQSLDASPRRSTSPHRQSLPAPRHRRPRRAAPARASFTCRHRLHTRQLQTVRMRADHRDRIFRIRAAHAEQLVDLVEMVPFVACAQHLAVQRTALDTTPSFCPEPRLIITVPVPSSASVDRSSAFAGSTTGRVLVSVAPVTPNTGSVGWIAVPAHEYSRCVLPPTVSVGAPVWQLPGAPRPALGSSGCTWQRVRSSASAARRARPVRVVAAARQDPEHIDERGDHRGRKPGRIVRKHVLHEVGEFGAAMRRADRRHRRDEIGRDGRDIARREPAPAVADEIDLGRPVAASTVFT